MGSFLEGVFDIMTLKALHNLSLKLNPNSIRKNNCFMSISKSIAVENHNVKGISELSKNYYGSVLF
jgi:hypothetical protein